MNRFFNKKDNSVNRSQSMQVKTPDLVRSNEALSSKQVHRSPTILSLRFKKKKNLIAGSDQLPKIYLRQDQRLADRAKNWDSCVQIIAPDWMPKALEQLSSVVPPNSQFLVLDQTGNHIMHHINEEGITVKDLVIIARNEPQNDGPIDFDNYEPLIQDKSIVYSIKDLAKLCLIAGHDMMTHFGGYRGPRVQANGHQVIVIDLIGLHFQPAYSSGRLVLVGKNVPKGLLDDFIFENVVGELKKPFEECLQDSTGRYEKIGEVLFDTFAFRRFVALDFFLAGFASNKLTRRPVNFKFLNYIGICSNDLKPILQRHILDGIIDGIELLFANVPVDKIKSVEFGYFREDPKISEACIKYKVDCRFSNNDALFPDPNNLMTATTTCSSPHTVLGNRMGNTIDGVIAKNLISRGHKFNPIINQTMGHEFVKVNFKSSRSRTSTSTSATSRTRTTSTPAKSLNQVDNLVKEFEAKNKDTGKQMVFAEEHFKNSNDTKEDIVEQSIDTPPETATIHLRFDQLIADRKQAKFQDSNVAILAPEWVKSALKMLSKHVPPGSRVTIKDQNGSQTIHRIGASLTLKDLVMLSRNQPVNVSGIIEYEDYKPLINDKAVVYSIKDLARQCVIVGRDQITHYGGYRCPRIEKFGQVILVDLIGLQFQKAYNTGRLVLIGRNQPKGLLDEMIFEKVVGEKKKSYEECLKDTSGRYQLNGDVFFDSFAYQRFVAADFVLAGLAIQKLANKPVNFKFLKYGTGFFAGDLAEQLNQSIGVGVSLGIELLFKNLTAKNQKSLIMAIDLPFFDRSQMIVDLCQRHKVQCQFTTSDALNNSLYPDLTLATTNCSDPHAACGNEMNFQSVDAAIAENLVGRGYKFNPAVNLIMTSDFVKVDYLGRVGSIGTPSSCPSTPVMVPRHGPWSPRVGRNLTDNEKQMKESFRANKTDACPSKTVAGEVVNEKTKHWREEKRVRRGRNKPNSKCVLS